LAYQQDDSSSCEGVSSYNKIMYRKWLLLGIISIVILPIVFYLSWCWGWWGSNNLGLRYLLQCACPRSSEQSRYPKQVEVVISACEDASSVSIVPGGRWLFVSRPPETYLFNLQTRERVPFVNPGVDTAFLNDEWVYYEKREGDAFLWNWQTGERKKLDDFSKYPNAFLSFDDRRINRDALGFLSDAKQIHLVMPGHLTRGGVAIVEFSTSRPPVFISKTFFWRDDNLEQLLREKSSVCCNLVEVSKPFGQLWLSHDGRFVAQDASIYLKANQEVIVRGKDLNLGKFLSLIGWIYDDRGGDLYPAPVYLLVLNGVDGGWSGGPGG
jgi:hypothetical protein